MNGGNENKIYWAKRATLSGYCSHCFGPHKTRHCIGQRAYHYAKKKGHRALRRKVKQEMKV